MLPELPIPPAVVTLLAIVFTATAAYLSGRSKRARSAVIRFETELRQWLEDRWGVPSPDATEVANADLDAALQEAIPAYDGDAVPIDVRMWDGTYLAPAPDEIDLLAVPGKLLALFPYRPARFDCEQFAGFYWALVPLLLGVNTVGLVNDTSAGHAYNVIVDAEGGVHVYEPQDGVFLELGETRNGVTYSLKSGEITF